jgi:hypothetical protein
VLQIAPEGRHLWRFDAKGSGFALDREETSFAGEPLPRGAVAKDWRTFFQPKLNVAWLPPEKVFLRVIQVPRSDADETAAMVELQLEKLSPIPVTQIVWSLQILPQAQGNMQTVIALIVAREVVEEFLGNLEGMGFLADRLELPMLDQLRASPITEDGAWIYPDVQSGRNTALVAWWYNGVLQTLDLASLPPAKRAESMREQLVQMAWAGELDGWLTAPPRWHLVADPPLAAEWEPALREGLDQPVEVVSPLSLKELAALTCARAAKADVRASLLPPEYSTRYQGQLLDRLWMRALLGVFALYLIGVAIYMTAVGVATFQTSRVEQEVASKGPAYTNAIQLKARYNVLKQRQELKFAALDCWKKLAESMPDDLQLESWNFSEGRRLVLSGTVPNDQASKVGPFRSQMSKSTVGDPPQLLFDPIESQDETLRQMGASTTWNFTLLLKRTEAL